MSRHPDILKYPSADRLGNDPAYRIQNKLIELSNLTAAAFGQDKRLVSDSTPNVFVSMMREWHRTYDIDVNSSVRVIQMWAQALNLELLDDQKESDYTQSVMRLLSSGGYAEVSQANCLMWLSRLSKRFGNNGGYLRPEDLAWRRNLRTVAEYQAGLAEYPYDSKFLASMVDRGLEQEGVYKLGPLGCIGSVVALFINSHAVGKAYLGGLHEARVQFNAAEEAAITYMLINSFNPFVTSNSVIEKAYQSICRLRRLYVPTKELKPQMLVTQDELHLLVGMIEPVKSEFLAATNRVIRSSSSN